MKGESDQENNQVQHKNNPIKRAQKQKQFRTVGQLKEVFTNPQDLYECVNKYTNTIKKVLNQHPINKRYNIMDFSLNARGPDQDTVYVKQIFYRSNIRRGNTIIYDTTNKNSMWGRKGLMKFFDISMSSLEAIANQDIVSLTKKDQYNHYAVFTQVQNVLSCNDQLQQKDKAKVHVYRLNKANGQNAQISYFKPTDQWVISSKNVSLLVKSPNDLKYYDGQRYQFAKLMAQTWFNMIKQKNKNQIQQLKVQLTGKTFVGQYCGNPDFQHLVKYKDITIYLYAVVQNDSSFTCIPPNEAFKIFEHHKLPIVKNYQKSLFGTYSNFVTLGKQLANLFSQVSRSSIFEDQQGSVVYFVIQKPKIFCEFISDRYLQKTVPLPEKWQTKQSWFHVSSLGKLKTLQYRILRKLRQKLKSFCRVKHGKQEEGDKSVKKFNQKYGSFEKQCHSLLKNQKLNKPIEYYFCVSLIAFDYVFKNRKSTKNLQLLNDHYLDFLSLIFWSVQNKKQVTPGLMTEYKLIQELRGQNWENYNIQIVKDYQNLLNKIVPIYAFIKKKIQLSGQNYVEQNQKQQLQQDIQ